MALPEPDRGDAAGPGIDHPQAPRAPSLVGEHGAGEHVEAGAGSTESGLRVVPLNYHGKYVYLTKREHRLHLRLLYGFLAAILVAVGIDAKCDSFQRRARRG
jgi:hypothetical protein